jgi:hypothetical protein
MYTAISTMVQMPKITLLSVRLQSACRNRAMGTMVNVLVRRATEALVLSCRHPTPTAPMPGVRRSGGIQPTKPAPPGRAVGPGQAE